MLNKGIHLSKFDAIFPLFSVVSASFGANISRMTAFAESVVRDISVQRDCKLPGPSYPIRGLPRFEVEMRH